MHAPCSLPQPEMCCNVQRYSKAAYLRKAEAEQCQVQSTLLLPLFINAQRSGCVGVLEVVQTSEDMAFIDVAKLLATSLEVCWSVLHYQPVLLLLLAWG